MLFRSSCPVLSCSVLFRPVPSCSILFCPVPSCSILFCPVLFCPVLFRRVLPGSILFHSVPSCAAQALHPGSSGDVLHRAAGARGAQQRPPHRGPLRRPGTPHPGQEDRPRPAVAMATCHQRSEGGREGQGGGGSLEGVSEGGREGMFPQGMVRRGDVGRYCTENDGVLKGSWKCVIIMSVRGLRKCLAFAVTPF